MINLEADGRAILGPNVAVLLLGCCFSIRHYRRRKYRILYVALSYLLDGVAAA